MIFGDKFKKRYYGNYRAKIEEIDKTNKNGIYKIRVYPFMADLKAGVLPKATSNLTTRYQHVQLYAGDWVWVFFENGDQHYPVIWDLCNYKGSYPTPSGGTYGKYDKVKFGDSTIEFDETLNTITINSKSDVNIIVESGTVAVKATSVVLNSSSITLGNGLTGYVVTSTVPNLSTVASGMPLTSSGKVKAGL